MLMGHTDDNETQNSEKMSQRQTMTPTNTIPQKYNFFASSASQKLTLAGIGSTLVAFSVRTIFTLNLRDYTEIFFWIGAFLCFVFLESESKSPVKERQPANPELGLFLATVRRELGVDWMGGGGPRRREFHRRRVEGGRGEWGQDVARKA
jgi:hypothetical protein